MNRLAASEETRKSEAEEVGMRSLEARTRCVVAHGHCSIVQTRHSDKYELIIMRILDSP